MSLIHIGSRLCPRCKLLDVPLHDPKWGLTICRVCWVSSDGCQCPWYIIISFCLACAYNLYVCIGGYVRSCWQYVLICV